MSFIRQLCQILKNEGSTGIEKCIEVIENSYGRKFSAEGRVKVVKNLNTLKIKVQKDVNVHQEKKLDRLVKRVGKTFHFEEEWLIHEENMSIDEEDQPSTSSPKSVGRPAKRKYEEMGTSTKYKYLKLKTEEINNLDAALEVTKRLARKESTRKLINMVIDAIKEDKEEELLELIKQTPVKKLDAEQGLSMMMLCDLSVNTYNKLRKGLKENGADILPSYQKIWEFKKD